VNELLAYTVTLDLLILVYVQFVMMMIILIKVLSQELKCICSQTATPDCHSCIRM